MKYTSIKTWLRSYSIYGRRSTTISHGFASAIAPVDAYDEPRVKTALTALGQDADNLTCVFCGRKAETWDHLVKLVSNKLPHGYGHQLGNLVPCCRNCNSEKGGRDWRDYLREKIADDVAYEAKVTLIQAHLDAHAIPVNLERMRIEHSDDWQEFCEIKEQIFALMRKADEIAPRLRQGRE
jgi:hypothetical protein